MKKEKEESIVSIIDHTNDIYDILLIQNLLSNHGFLFLSYFLSSTFVFLFSISYHIYIYIYVHTHTHTNVHTHTNTYAHTHKVRQPIIAKEVYYAIGSKIFLSIQLL